GDQSQRGCSTRRQQRRGGLCADQRRAEQDAGEDVPDDLRLTERLQQSPERASQDDDGGEREQDMQEDVRYLQITTPPPCWHWHTGVFCFGQLAVIENATPPQVTLQENLFAASSSADLFAAVANSAAPPTASAAGGGAKSTDCE